MNEKLKRPNYIVIEESIFQSITRDSFTFGCIIVCILVSKGSLFWSLFSGFLCAIYLLYLSLGYCSSINRFKSKDKLFEWLQEQPEEVDFFSWPEAEAAMAMDLNVARDVTFCDKFYYLYRGDVVCVYRNRVRDRIYNQITEEDKAACDWRVSP